MRIVGTMIISDILQYPFFYNAIVVGILASIACGVMGTYIVTKRLSLITGSIAHTAFGGVGVAVFFNLNPLLGATWFCIASAGLIGAIRQYWPQHEDALVSAMWAVGMAIGMVLVHFKGGYAGDMVNYLFGNILLTNTEDMMIIIGLNVIVLVTVFLLYRSFQALTFDEEFAKTRNVKVSLLSIILFILIALTTVALLRVVGLILVITLLSLPAAAALNMSVRFGRIQAIAAIISALSTTVGLLLSFVYDLPSGPCIIFAVTTLYILSFLFKRFAK